MTGDSRHPKWYSDLEEAVGALEKCMPTNEIPTLEWDAVEAFIQNTVSFGEVMSAVGTLLAEKKILPLGQDFNYWGIGLEHSLPNPPREHDKDWTLSHWDLKEIKRQINQHIESPTTKLRHIHLTADIERYHNSGRIGVLVRGTTTMRAIDSKPAQWRIQVVAAESAKEGISAHPVSCLPFDLDFGGTETASSEQPEQECPYRVGSSVAICYQELNELGVNDPDRAKESTAKLIKACLFALSKHLELAYQRKR